MHSSLRKSTSHLWKVLCARHHPRGVRHSVGSLAADPRFYEDDWHKLEDPERLGWSYTQTGSHRNGEEASNLGNLALADYRHHSIAYTGECPLVDPCEPHGCRPEV